MHVLIINFSLDGLPHEDYLKTADELAPAFAEVSGLKSNLDRAGSLSPQHRCYDAHHTGMSTTDVRRLEPSYLVASRWHWSVWGEPVHRVGCGTGGPAFPERSGQVSVVSVAVWWS